MSDVILFNGDCLEEMKKIETGSVDLILTDPPYGTITNIPLKGYVESNTSWDLVIPLDDMFSECNRVLRGGGRLILFGQEPFTSDVIKFYGTPAANNIVFNYRMMWLKDHFANCLLAKKAPVSHFEDIMVFTKKYDWDQNNPLREYARKLFVDMNKTKKELREIVGNGALDHFLRYNSTQFGIPTEKTYQILIDKLNIDNIAYFKKYTDLKKELVDLKPIFNLEPGKKVKSNVLQYKKDRGGFHPTQKPVSLMEDLVLTFSNVNDNVLDFTMGSGSTGVACINQNRNFIGIEKDPDFFLKAKERLETLYKKHKNLEDLL